MMSKVIYKITYLILNLRNCNHGVSVDIGAGRRPQPILGNVHHSSTVHDGIPVHLNVLQVMLVS